MHAHALDRLDSRRERDDSTRHSARVRRPRAQYVAEESSCSTSQGKARCTRALQPNLGNSHLDGRRVQPSLPRHHTVPQPQPVPSAIQTFHLERAELIKSTFDNFPPFEMEFLWQVLPLTDFIPAM